MDLDSHVEDFILAFGDLIKNITTEFMLRNMKHGLFVPTFTPDNVTLGIESWVLGTVLQEFRMRVIHTDHNAEVLLDS